MTLRSKRLAALAATCAIGVLLVYLLAVRTELGQRVDEAALNGRAAVPDEFVSDAWTILDVVGVVSLLGTIGVLWSVALFRRRPGLVIAVTGSIIGANVTTQVLKHVVFDRPNIVVTSAIEFNTLPSGHTTVAASVAFGLVLVAAAQWRAWAALLAAGYAAVVGVATVTAGWHRPSDALAAVFVAGAWTAAAAALTPEDGGEPGPVSSVTIWSAGIAIGMIGVGSGFGWAVVRVLADAADSSALARLESGFAHLTAGAGIAIVALMVAGGLVLASASVSSSEPRATLGAP